jgi:3-oxoacyl-[acyl-carrier protein] reductase
LPLEDSFSVREAFCQSNFNMSFNLSLKGRVALVTGSSTGLGKSIAQTLGQAGAKVALNYANNRERAEKSFAEFHAAGGVGRLFRADVTDAGQIQSLFSEIRETLGPVDLLVVNATCDQPHRPVEEYDWATFQAMVDFFIKSPFLLTQACVAHMKAQRWGRIINIGSEVFQRGVPNFTAYVAAKGGQTGFHRSLANELAPSGITVNMVSPGWIPVERHANDSQKDKDDYRALIPAGRWGVPSDVAGAVAFLASDAAGFVTGQNLSVNGGMTVA